MSFLSINYVATDIIFFIKDDFMKIKRFLLEDKLKSNGLSTPPKLDCLASDALKELQASIDYVEKIDPVPISDNPAVAQALIAPSLDEMKASELTPIFIEEGKKRIQFEFKREKLKKHKEVNQVVKSPDYQVQDKTYATADRDYLIYSSESIGKCYMVLLRLEKYCENGKNEIKAKEDVDEKTKDGIFSKMSPEQKFAQEFYVYLFNLKKQAQEERSKLIRAMYDKLMVANCDYDLESDDVLYALAPEQFSNNPKYKWLNLSQPCFVLFHCIILTTNSLINPKIDPNFLENFGWFASRNNNGEQPGISFRVKITYSQPISPPNEIKLDAPEYKIFIFPQGGEQPGLTSIDFKNAADQRKLFYLLAKYNMAIADYMATSAKQEKLKIAKLVKAIKCYLEFDKTLSFFLNPNLLFEPEKWLSLRDRERGILARYILETLNSQDNEQLLLEPLLSTQPLSNPADLTTPDFSLFKKSQSISLLKEVDKARQTIESINKKNEPGMFARDALKTFFCLDALLSGTQGNANNLRSKLEEVLTRIKMEFEKAIKGPNRAFFAEPNQLQQWFSNLSVNLLAENARQAVDKIIDLIYEKNPLSPAEYENLLSCLGSEKIFWDKITRTILLTHAKSCVLRLSSKWSFLIEISPESEKEFLRSEWSSYCMYYYPQILIELEKFFTKKTINMDTNLDDISTYMDFALNMEKVGASGSPAQQQTSSLENMLVLHVKKYQGSFEGHFEIFAKFYKRLSTPVLFVTYLTKYIIYQFRDKFAFTINEKIESYLLVLHEDKKTHTYLSNILCNFLKNELSKTESSSPLPKILTMGQQSFFRLIRSFLLADDAAEIAIISDAKYYYGLVEGPLFTSSLLKNQRLRLDFPLTNKYSELLQEHYKKWRDSQELVPDQRAAWTDQLFFLVEMQTYSPGEKKYKNFFADNERQAYCFQWLKGMFTGAPLILHNISIDTNPYGYENQSDPSFIQSTVGGFLPNFFTLAEKFFASPNETEVCWSILERLFKADPEKLSPPLIGDSLLKFQTLSNKIKVISEVKEDSITSASKICNKPGPYKSIIEGRLKFLGGLKINTNPSLMRYYYDHYLRRCGEQLKRRISTSSSALISAEKSHGETIKGYLGDGNVANEFSANLKESVIFFCDNIPQIYHLQSFFQADEAELINSTNWLLLFTRLDKIPELNGVPTQTLLRCIRDGFTKENLKKLIDMFNTLPIQDNHFAADSLQSICTYLESHNGNSTPEKKLLLIIDAVRIHANEYDDDNVEKLNDVYKKYYRDIDLNKPKQELRRKYGLIYFIESLTLDQNQRAVEWRNKLERVFPERVFPEKVDDTGDTYYGFSITDRVVDKNLQVQLKKVKDIEIETASRHRVFEHRQSNGDSTYSSFIVKYQPDLPVAEMMSRALQRALGDPYVPYGELICMHDRKNNQKKIFFISEKFSGKRLDQCWQDNSINWEPKAFLWRFLGALLNGPADGKPENEIAVTNNYDGRLVITRCSGIDTDLGFVPFCSSPTKHSPQIKLNVVSVIFCFDEMKQPIAKNLLEMILAINPYNFLRNWLLELEGYQSILSKLFDKDEIEQFGLHLPITALLIEELYEKITRIQSYVIKTSESITPFSLMRALDPNFAAFYEDAFEKQQSPAERFYHIATVSGAYEIHTKNHLRNYVTSLSVGQLFNKMAPYSQTNPTFLDIRQALDKLNSIQTYEQSYDDKIKQMMSGQIDLSEDKSTSLLEAPHFFVERLIEKIATQVKNPDADLQKRIIQVLQKVKMLRLILVGLDKLEPSDFRQLVCVGGPNMKESILTYLRIESCQLITFADIEKVASSCIYVEKLVLINFADPSSEIQFTANQGWHGLKRISIKNQKNVKKITIDFLQVESIEIIGCENLEQLVINCPCLKHLALKDCRRLTKISRTTTQQDCLEFVNFNNIAISELELSVLFDRYRQNQLIPRDMLIVNCERLYFKEFRASYPQLFDLPYITDITEIKDRFDKFFPDLSHQWRNLPLNNLRQIILEINQRKYGIREITYVFVRLARGRSALHLRQEALSTLIKLKIYHPRAVEAMLTILRRDGEDDKKLIDLATQGLIAATKVYPTICDEVCELAISLFQQEKLTTGLISCLGLLGATHKKAVNSLLEFLKPNNLLLPDILQALSKVEVECDIAMVTVWELQVDKSYEKYNAEILLALAKLIPLVSKETSAEKLAEIEKALLSDLDLEKQTDSVHQAVIVALASFPTSAANVVKAIKSSLSRITEASLIEDFKSVLVKFKEDIKNDLCEILKSGSKASQLVAAEVLGLMAQKDLEISNRLWDHLLNPQTQDPKLKIAIINALTKSTSLPVPDQATLVNRQCELTRQADFIKSADFTLSILQLFSATCCVDKPLVDWISSLVSNNNWLVREKAIATLGLISHKYPLTINFLINQFESQRSWFETGIAQYRTMTIAAIGKFAGSFVSVDSDLNEELKVSIVLVITKSFEWLQDEKYSSHQEQILEIIYQLVASSVIHKHLPDSLEKLSDLKASYDNSKYKYLLLKIIIRLALQRREDICEWLTSIEENASQSGVLTRIFINYIWLVLGETNEIKFKLVLSKDVTPYEDIVIIKELQNLAKELIKSVPSTIQRLLSQTVSAVNFHDESLELSENMRRLILKLKKQVVFEVFAQFAVEEIKELKSLLDAKLLIIKSLSLDDYIMTMFSQGDITTIITELKKLASENQKFSPKILEKIEASVNQRKILLCQSMTESQIKALMYYIGNFCKTFKPDFDLFRKLKEKVRVEKRQYWYQLIIPWDVIIACNLEKYISPNLANSVSSSSVNMGSSTPSKIPTKQSEIIFYIPPSSSSMQKQDVKQNVAVLDERIPSQQPSTVSTVIFSPSQTQPKVALLKAKLPNTQPQVEVEFEENEVTTDGDCSFTALGTDRKTLAETLLPLKNNAQDREFLAEEIMNAFVTYTVTNEKDGLRPDDDSAWKKLQAELDDAQMQLDAYHRKICDGLTDQRAKTLPLDSLITWLEENKKSSEAQVLKNQRLKVFQAESARTIYCQKPAVFEYYVKALGNSSTDRPLSLGYKSALLFAKQKDMTLYIWRKNDKVLNHLVLLHQHRATDNATNEIHILHTHFFTRLSRPSMQKQDVTQKVIFPDKKQTSSVSQASFFPSPTTPLQKFNTLSKELCDTLKQNQLHFELSKEHSKIFVQLDADTCDKSLAEKILLLCQENLASCFSEYISSYARSDDSVLYTLQVNAKTPKHAEKFFALLEKANVFDLVNVADNANGMKK